MSNRRSLTWAASLVVAALFLATSICPEQVPRSYALGRRGPEPVIEFPYLLRIAEGGVLVVHGHDFRDSVWVTWEHGDSLRVNGLPVVPPPKVPDRIICEGSLAHVYRKVPYIRNLVEGGSTWRQASQAFHDSTDRIKRSMSDLYKEVMNSTGSHETALRAVRASIDRSLLEPGEPIEIKYGYLEVTFRGMYRDIIMCPMSEPSEGPYLPKEYDEKRMKSETRRLVRLLSPPRRGHAFVSISPRGQGSGGGSEAIEQVDKAKRGIRTDGFMDYIELERVFHTNVTSEAERRKLTGAICGSVVDADDKTPLDLASVRLDRTFICGDTGADGRFEIPDLLAGWYEGLVFRYDYETVNMDSVEVRPGEKTELRFELKKENSRKENSRDER